MFLSVYSYAQTYCNIPNLPQATTSGIGAYKSQLVFFDWGTKRLANGITASTTVNGITYTATVSSYTIVKGSTAPYIGQDINTWTGAGVKELYNVSGINEGFYTTADMPDGFLGNETQATITVTATIAGVPVNSKFDIVGYDLETTYPGQESIKFSANGPITVLESYNGGPAAVTGVGTNSVTITNSQSGTSPFGNAMYTAVGQNSMTFNIVGGSSGKQGFGMAIRLQCPPTFTCDTNMYIIQGAASELFRIDTSANPFNFIKISGTPYTTAVNATAYNVKDNYIYGITGGAGVAKRLIRIDSNGVFYDLGDITGLDITAGYTAGEMDENGNYYIKLAGTGNKKLYKVDIATRSATLIELSRNINFIDIAYTLTDKLLWAQDTVSKKLVSINPTTGVVTDLPFENVLSDYGAWFGSSTGQIYASSNAGTAFVEFNKTTGEAQFISKTQPSSSNDGAHCPTAPIKFDLYCSKLPVINAGVSYPSKHGITALERAGADNGNWPMVRQSAWTVLEANTKGFVVNRVANPATDIVNPVEGMMVFDTTLQCLKIYDGTAWFCYSAPACPK